MSTVAVDVSRSFGHGGIPMYGRELVRHLAQLSGRPSLLLATRGKVLTQTHQLVQGCADVTVRTGLVHPLALGSLGKPLVFAYHRARWKHWQTDCQLVHWLEPGIEFPRRLPYVVTVHDLFPLDRSIPSPEHLRTNFERLIGPAVEEAQRVIVPSHFVRQELLSLVPSVEHRVSVVPLGVSDAFAPSLRDRPFAGPYVVWIGRLDERKNLVRLLHAWKQLPETLRTKVRLVLIGPWTLEHVHRAHPELAAAMVELQCIVLSKVSAEEHAQLLTHAEALLFPSLAEGFGLPVIEAMKCGCPVVTSSVSSLPEVGGSAAVYVDPWSVDSIREGIERVLTDADLRSSLKRDGLLRAQQFSWNACAAATVAVYNTALESAQ